MATVEMMDNGNVKINIPILLRSNSGRRRIIAPEVIDSPADPIVQNIARAYRWQQLIDQGVYSNVKELAQAIGKDNGYVARTIRLALLCPEIVHAALTGSLPDSVSLDSLRNASVDNWAEQKKIVGMG